MYPSFNRIRLAEIHYVELRDITETKIYMNSYMCPCKRAINAQYAVFKLSYAMVNINNLHQFRNNSIMFTQFREHTDSLNGSHKHFQLCFKIKKKITCV